MTRSRKASRSPRSSHLDPGPRRRSTVEDPIPDAATDRSADHTDEDAPMEAVPVGVAGISRWVGTGDRGWWLSLWERPMGYRWHR